MKRLVMMMLLAGCTHGEPVVDQNPSPAGPVEPPSVTVADAEPPRGAEAVWTNTTHVEGLARSTGHVWVATRGGVERYALDGTERRLFTTQDGLDEVHVRDIRVEADGVVVAVTGRSQCRLTGQRFACEPMKTHVPARRSRGLFRGRRITSELEVPGGVLVGTGGAGLWLTGDDAPRRWTPTGQVCGPHVTSLAHHEGTLYVGTFHQGLCIRQGDGHEMVEAPFAMVNEMASTPMGLVVAASEGLFVRGGDGSFEEIALADDVRVVNSVVWHEDALWATTPESLWRISTTARPPVLRLRNPAGSVSLQAVASNGSTLWLASEDRGAIRFDGRSQFTAYDATRGLPASWAIDVLVQPDGNAWVATLRHGILNVSHDEHRAIVAPNPWTLRLEHIHGWNAVGTQAGASLVSGDRVHELRGLPDRRVHAFLAVGDRLWVGTERGIARYPLP